MYFFFSQNYKYGILLRYIPFQICPEYPKNRLYFRRWMPCQRYTISRWRNSIWMTCIGSGPIRPSSGIISSQNNSTKSKRLPCKGSRFSSFYRYPVTQRRELSAEPMGFIQIHLQPDNFLVRSRFCQHCAIRRHNHTVSCTGTAVYFTGMVAGQQEALVFQRADPAEQSPVLQPFPGPGG